MSWKDEDAHSMTEKCRVVNSVSNVWSGKLYQHNVRYQAIDFIS